MKEYDLSVNKELRETCMERVDVLEKVKKLFLIPGMEVMTTKQVAEYFEVDSETIQKLYQRNKAELDLAGTTLKSLAEFKLDKAPVQSNKRGVTTFQISEGSYIEVSNRGVKCFTRKAVLRIAMLLRNSEIAKEVREQLIADGANLVAESEEPKTDKFDLIKSLVNQKFGEVRVLVENDTVLFCGSDVARALGYANPLEAILDHCKGIAKRYSTVHFKTQEINFIPEGDVYRLIVRSKLPEAEEFEHWLFDEMLPTLRKGGAYITDEEKVIDTYFKNLPEDQKTFMSMMFKNLREQIEENERLARANNDLTEVNKLLSAGVNTWDNKAMLNAMVRSAAVNQYRSDYMKAWGAFYKQLLYKEGINLTKRSGEGSKISKIRDDEWAKVLQVAAAWIMGMGVDVVNVINSVNAAAITT